jgi:tRNA dimethylallyltransferase
MSIGRSPRAARRRFSMPRMSLLPSKGMSTATSLNSQRAAPGEGRTARAPSTIVESSAGSAGLQMSVATRDMQVNSQGENKAVLIAGPTASGKSALALELARTHDAVIINTDSMQVYRDLRVITARPTPAEEAGVPHRLYGHVDAAVNFSAGAWVADASAALAEARTQKRLPIFVGGSGLYFRALTRGLSAVPPIAAEIRDSVRARLERNGVEALHAELVQTDPASAERLKPRDRIRIARALEVVEATGRSLTDWHRDGLPPLLPPGQFSALFLAPERDDLYARIDARFDVMLKAGALEEVAALAARRLDPLLPAMKAHGVPALIRHLQGEISLEQAAVIGRADTRHYAKRQFTWFRHQLPEFEWVKPAEARAWLQGAFSLSPNAGNPAKL